MAKAPQLIQHYVTAGDRSLRDWHYMLRRVTFGAALVLMGASVVSLHWACNLIGLTGYWEPVAWAVPLAMELGMAAVASTATTIRKDTGRYYWSLWAIFSFVMLLAQASNIGHAVVTVAENDALPPVIPVEAVYVFAAAFAALFPLGGTLFVHVSGFLRANGTGARWIEGDAEVVHEQVAPGEPAHRAPVRTNRPAARAPQAPAPAQPARTEAAQVSSVPRSEPSVRPLPSGDAEKDRARAIYERMVAADPLSKPDAAAIHREAGVQRNIATTRRWVKDWWDATQESLGMGGGDPLGPQIATEGSESATSHATRSA